MTKLLQQNWKYYIVSFLLFWIAIPQCQAQPMLSADQVWGDPLIQLTKKDGLPNVYFKDYLQDENGFVWIATYDALLRFDGIELKPFPLDTGVITQIVAIAEDEKRNHLWVGCLDAIYKIDLVSNKPEKIFQIHRDSIWKVGHLLSMLIDRNDRLWLGKDLGFMIVDLNKNQLTNGSSKLRKDSIRIPRNIYSILQDPVEDELFWMGTDFGLVKYHHELGQTFSYRPPGQPVQSFFRIVHHLFYSEAIHSLIYSNDVRSGRPMDYHFLVFDLATETYTDKITFDPQWKTRGIFPKDKNHLWLSTDQGVGVYQLSTNELDTVFSSELKEGNPVRIDFIDRGGRIWSNAKNAINIYISHDSPIEHFYYETNFPKGYHVCNDLLVANQKIYMSVFAGDGIYALDLQKKEWEILIDRQHDDPKLFMGTSLDSLQGGQILALANNESYIVGEDQLYPFRPAGQNLHFGEGFVDGDGFLWGLTSGKLIKMDLSSGQVEEFDQLSEGCMKQHRAFKPMMDEDHNLWFLGVCPGFILYRSDLKQFVHSRKMSLDSRLDSYIVDVEVQKKRAYIITENGVLGVFKITESNIEILEIIDLLPRLPNHVSMAPSCSVIDSEGILWILSDIGLLRFDPTNHSIQVFDEEDDIVLKDKELGVIVAEQMTIVDKHRIVYSTRKGIHIVNTQKLQTEYTRPVPYVSSFLVNNVVYPADSSAALKKKYVLKPIENYLTFEFSAIDFDYPHLTQFAHKLMGLDEDWVVSQRRNVTYSNLPGGDYCLQLKAKRGDGEWSPVSVIDIRILKKWYQTWIARILAVVLLLGVAYGVYKSRIRLAVEKQKIKSDYERNLAEVKMNALTAQMNPHFIFNSLNSIDYYIIKNDTLKASDYLNRFARLIRLILNHSRSNYITLRDDLEALKLYIEIESMRFNEKFDYVVEAGNNVDLDLIQIPPLLLQPYVENAIWHGLMHKSEKGCLKIKVELDETEQSIIVVIEDNGVGRQKAAEFKSKDVKHKERKSMGMAITQNKLEIINFLHNLNATSEVEDVIDRRGEVAGTRVTLSIPI